MPLLDHFHPPLYPQRSWESFHSRWANAIVDALNATLPRRFFAEVQIHLDSQIEADVAEIQVRDQRNDARLVGAVELVSPRNKDRPDSRRAFAVKCAAYLQCGIGLMVLDIVTGRQGNMHNELVGLMNLGEASAMPNDVSLYAVAYQPLRRQEVNQIDVWPVTLAVGGALPVLPLALRGFGVVPIDLEATYTEARQRSRL